MAACNPQKLIGNWHSGIALDVHTTSSFHVGVDELGHNNFETTYSELGGLLHRLKYKSARSVAPEIVQTAVDFLRPRRNKFDLIVVKVMQALSMRLRLDWTENVKAKSAGL